MSNSQWSCAPPPTPPPALRPVALPYRVQGLHVAAFATQRASRARKIMLLYALLAAINVLMIASPFVHVNDVEDVFKMHGVSIVFVIAGVVLGWRKLDRARQFQRVAEAAQLQPIAVWGVKDKRLYPLDPKAPRDKLTIVLDATDHTLIYQKPRAPIGGPAEPHP